MEQTDSDVFDSARCAAMERAFNRAWAEVEWTGFKGQPEDAIRTAVMRAILEAAQHGVTSETALADYALLHYRQTQGEPL